MSAQFRKRNATSVAGVKGYQPRISKDTYDKLIGNHEHIEHESLRKEMVSEFKSQIESYNINENLSKKEIDINKEYGLFPPQPPHLPCEQTSNTNFVISMAWPYYSNLQRASKLFYSDMYDELLIEKYLIYRIGLNKDQVNMAKEIANLIWNSETYQRKIRRSHSDYEQRYSNNERRNALKIMPWKLKIALTLHDFHIDHIVDIVNNNSKKWINDFDDYSDNDNETYNFDTNDSAQSLYSDNTDDNSEDNVILPKNNNNNNNSNGSSKPAKKTKTLVKSKSVYNTAKASKSKNNNALKVNNNNGNDRSVKNAYKNKSRNRSERKSLQPMKTKDRDMLRARSLTRKNKKTNSLKVNNDDDNGSLSHAHSNKQKSKKKKNQQMRKSDLSMIKKNYNHKSQSLYKNINKGSQLKKTQSIENNDNNNGKLKEYKQKKKVKYRVKNEIFEIFDYYRPIRLIGSGAYAVVCEAIDKRNGKKVAIKKNKHIFDDIRDARRILREIKLLMHFDKHPDIIDLYDTIPPYLDEIESFSDVYIVMPLLESNLCKIITSSQPLTNLHYQYLTYQVLRGLKYIHSTGVIHRDIKPENILLNGKDCDVKIIDFGLARGVLKDEDNRLKEQNTEYVCTRWYRSPEVMCSGGMYDEKMDIWGVGCLLAEMILRRPLFPGNNYMDQLKIIFEIMGTPKTTEWIKNEQAKKWVKKLKPNKGKSLKKMMKNKFDNENDLNNCVDLLYKLLKLSPKERISANKSLKHPYFKDMHDASLATNGQKFDLSFEFEKSIKTKFGVRHMMYESLNQFHVIRKKKKKERKLRKLKQQQMQQQQMQKQTSSSNNNHENQL